VWQFWEGAYDFSKPDITLVCGQFDFDTNGDGNFVHWESGIAFSRLLPALCSTQYAEIFNLRHPNRRFKPRRFILLCESLLVKPPESPDTVENAKS
jgi:hypothetical protein